MLNVEHHTRLLAKCTISLHCNSTKPLLQHANTEPVKDEKPCMLNNHRRKFPLRSPLIHEACGEVHRNGEARACVLTVSC